MKKQTEPINLTLNSAADQKRLLELVILNAYGNFWGLNPEQELRIEVLHRQLPGELNLEKIRRDYCNKDLDQQLKILEDYIQSVLNYPYRGDMGVGGSRFMAVRYSNSHRFSVLAENFKDSAVSMYVNLWRVVLGTRLPACSEEKQSRLSADSPGNKNKSRKARSESETRILREKYPHFYELMEDQEALGKCFEGLKEVAGVTEIPDVLEPTMNLHEVFGVDSLEACELMARYEDEFEFSRSDLYPKNDSLGEWAKIIMIGRTI